MPEITELNPSTITAQTGYPGHHITRMQPSMSGCRPDNRVAMCRDCRASNKERLNQRLCKCRRACLDISYGGKLCPICGREVLC